MRVIWIQSAHVTDEELMVARMKVGPLTVSFRLNQPISVRCAAAYKPSAGEPFCPPSPLSYEPLTSAASTIYHNREDGGPGKKYMLYLVM